MKKIFICYYSGNRPEVNALVEELRIRGIEPWIDYDKGFRAGDATPSEARRALREDCFGLLFYATPEAFERDFIRKIELDQAIRLKEENKDFFLLAVPRRMSFSELAQLSLKTLGMDLSLFHSHPILDTDAEGINPRPLRPQFVEVANMILAKVLGRASQTKNATDFLSIHFNTREREPATAEDTLNIDWTPFLGGSCPSVSSEVWERLMAALWDVKRHISEELGRPKLRLLGRKHFSTAVAFGRTFPAASGFVIKTPQGHSWWSTACPPAKGEPFKVESVDGPVSLDSLFVEVTATEKLVRDAVRRFEQSSGISPLLYLRFMPSTGPTLGAVTDNAVCCAMARQIRKTIAEATTNYPITEIHLFGSMPQGLALMIGHHLNATRPVQLYEYDGTNYHPSLRFTI